MSDDKRPGDDQESLAREKAEIIRRTDAEISRNHEERRALALKLRRYAVESGVIARYSSKSVFEKSIFGGQWTLRRTMLIIAS
jgi:folylpolyglutamate synthase/dihydropteroate synthase